MNEFTQSTPNQLTTKEIRLYKKNDLITECVKCKGLAVSQGGTIYCNDCGTIENVFFRVNLKRK